MNKRLYKFLTIGSAVTAVVSPIAIVVSCGSSSKSSSDFSTGFEAREVRTYDQWIKDFPQFKNVIVNNKLVDNAFVDVVKLANNKLPNNFYLPDSVNEIGVGAFRGIEINNGFEFPYAMQVINKYAFQKAKLPEGFTIPKKLRTISSYAFADIEFPNKFSFDLFSTQFVVSDTAFANAKFAAGAKVSLTTFLGMKSRGANGVDFIAKDGRNNLDGNINDWSFPVKLTVIPASAFANAVIPNDFTFPFWLSGIGQGAFYNATLPTNFKISLVSSGNGLAKIESEAFRGATLAQGFQIIAENGNVPQVDGTAFYGAKATGVIVNRTTYDLLVQGGINSESEVLTESQTQVDDLSTTTENGHIKSYAYAGIDFTKTDASTQKVLTDLQNGSVSAIDNSAFAGAKFPAGFTIPASVKTIAYKAFANAVFLGDLTVPNTVTTMEASVFDNATGTKMIFNAGITTLPEGTFSVDEQNSGWSTVDPADRIIKGFLGGITFGAEASASINTIGKNAFDNVTLKAGFALPTALKILTTGAFIGTIFEEKLTVNITDLILQTEAFANANFKNGIDMSSSTIKTMANGVFSNAKVTATANIQLPAITAIPKSTFNGVVLPTAFSLPNTIVSIGESAFQQATLNSSFTLGNLTGLKEIGVSAFRGKGNDVDKTTGEKIVVRGEIPAGFTVPSSVKTIRSGAFAYTDWSKNTSNGLRDLSANFKFSKDAVDGLIESGVFQGVILNDAFELPTTQDIIPSAMFQNAIFRNKDAKIITESFPRITIIGGSAFEQAELGFNLDGMTKLTTINSSAFRGANILTIPGATAGSVITISEFKIPTTVTTIEKDAFFGTYTLVDGVDWSGATVKVKRTVDWFFKDTAGALTIKAEEDNGNPKVGSYAKASDTEYVPEFSAGPAKGSN